MLRGRAIRKSEPIDAAMQRSVVILKDVLGHSLIEIGALLTISVDAVKAHLARGRARLREINAAAVYLSTAPRSH